MCMQETDWCGEMLARQLKGVRDLAPKVQCCALALAHAQMLQQLHSLALVPRVLRRLWSNCQEVKVMSRKLHQSPCNVQS